MALLMSAVESQFGDLNMDTVQSGLLYFYDTGTTTLKTIYSDAALQNALANPVSLTAAGKLSSNVYAPKGERYTIRLTATGIDESKDDVWGWAEETSEVVATLAALKALSADDGAQAFTAGYHAALDGGGAQYYFDAGSSDTDNGGTIIAPDTGSGRWRMVRHGRVSIKQFGARLNGTTDDTTAWQNALSALAGEEIFFPEGTSVITVDADNLLQPGLNTAIRGTGQSSILRLNMADANTYSVFQIANDGFRVQDMEIQINTSVTGGTLVLFSLAQGIDLINVEIDGRVTASISTSHACQIFKCTNTDSWGGLTISRCYFHDFTRCWLRENAATSTIAGIFVSLSRFESSEASMWALNAPNGAINDVKFLGNRFVNPFIGAVQSDSYCIGPQANNVEIIGNSFRGTGHEAIHIEEAAENISVTGNDINMNLANAGIFVTDNNIGGSSVTPGNVKITGNAIKRTDGDNATGSGIELANDGGEPPVTRYTITGNVILGWGEGVISGADADDIGIVADNVIEDCGVGLRPKGAAPNWRGNSIANCAIGIQSIGAGGLVGHNTFINCTTPVDAVTGELTLMGATFVFPDTDLTASGNTDFALLPCAANDDAFGHLTAHAFFDGTNEDIHMAEITVAAGALSQTAKLTRGGGQITISFLDSSNVLTLRCANSSSILSNAKVMAEFSGAYVVAA